MRIEWKHGTILFFLGQFILGIFEAIYLHRYDDQKHKCYSVWEWLVAGCVIDICIPVFARFGIQHREFDEYEQREFRKQNGCWLLAQLVVSIWSAVFFFDPNKECYNYWDTNAHELWIFVMVHFAMLWAIIAKYIIDVLFDDQCTLKCNFELSR